MYPIVEYCIYIFFDHILTICSYLLQAADRFQAVYPLIKELALAGSHNSKTTRPVAQQLLPLSLTALSQGGGFFFSLP